MGIAALHNRPINRAIGSHKEYSALQTMSGELCSPTLRIEEHFTLYKNG
jgi:hypothetical protein